MPMVGVTCAAWTGTQPGGRQLAPGMADWKFRLCGNLAPPSRQFAIANQNIKPSPPGVTLIDRLVTSCMPSTTRPRCTMTVLPLLEGLHLLDWRDITNVLKLTLTGLTVLSITAILVNEVIRFRNRIPRLPGPRGYPLLGSLPSLKNTATSEEYRLWANKYGPVFQVQLGNETAVVVNSAAAARALFITQREATNGRPISYVLHKQVQQGGPVTSIGTSPWDESCKRRRKVAATALNKAQVESYYPV
jgi:hypothetical protein